MKILQFYIYISVTIINVYPSWHLINTQEIVVIDKFMCFFVIYVFLLAFNKDVMYVI